MRRLVMASLAAALVLTATAAGQAVKPSDNPQIDYAGFLRLTAETEEVRDQRLISLDQFLAMAARPEVLILDARSAQAFAEGHIEGAVNLPLPDFTAESLAAVIGNPNRPVLIYCNNNFSNHVRPVPLKRIELALNILTFINLQGYGYRNVYELGGVVDFNEPRVRWVASPS